MWLHVTYASEQVRYAWPIVRASETTRRQSPGLRASRGRVVRSYRADRRSVPEARRSRQPTILHDHSAFRGRAGWTLAPRSTSGLMSLSSSTFVSSSSSYRRKSSRLSRTDLSTDAWSSRIQSVCVANSLATSQPNKNDVNTISWAPYCSRTRYT